MENVVGRSVGLDHSRVIPALRYRDVVAAIDWLCTAFGFEKHHVVTGDEGGILYAHLTLGNDMIMVRSVRDSHLDRLMKQPDEIGGAETQSCYFVIEDADAHYHKAKAAGADIVLDISDDDHGGRGYSCRDPEGHVWSFGTYDPWPRNPLTTSRGKKFNRPVIMAAMLASMTAAATAGWMLPRPIPNGDETRPKIDAVGAHERAEHAAARANMLAAELAQERIAKEAAERAADEARQQLAHEQGTKKTTERNSRQLEEQLAEERRAKDIAERTAKDARMQMAIERTAKEAAQRITSDTEKELTRERDTKQRAERSAQDALEQLASERRAKETAEREVKTAKKLLAEAQGLKKVTIRPAKAKGVDNVDAAPSPMPRVIP